MEILTWLVIILSSVAITISIEALKRSAKIENNLDLVKRVVKRFGDEQYEFNKDVSRQLGDKMILDKMISEAVREALH